MAKRQPPVKSIGSRTATIGDRIREERERLGLSQADFYGGEKSSQIRYEKGTRSPDADYLQRVADVGADVQYIVTGRRSGQPATPKLVSSTSPLNIEVLRQVIEGVEEILTTTGGKPKPAKKAEAIVLLYEHFQALGRVERGFIERQLRLVS